MSKEIVAFNNAVKLENEVLEVVSKYKDLTNDELVEKRSEINKDFNAYNKQRIAVKKEIDERIKDILKPIQDLKDNVDILYDIKEEQRKNEKLKTIRLYYDQTYNLNDNYWLRVFDNRWLNATHYKWQEELDQAINQINTDLKTINALGFNEQEYWNGKTIQDFYNEQETKEQFAKEIIEAEYIEIEQPSFLQEIETKHLLEIISTDSEFNAIIKFLEKNNITFKKIGGK